MLYCDRVQVSVCTRHIPAMNYAMAAILAMLAAMHATTLGTYRTVCMDCVHVTLDALKRM